MRHHASQQVTNIGCVENRTLLNQFSERIDAVDLIVVRSPKQRRDEIAGFASDQRQRLTTPKYARESGPLVEVQNKLIHLSLSLPAGRLTRRCLIALLFQMLDYGRQFIIGQAAKIYHHLRWSVVDGSKVYALPVDEEAFLPRGAVPHRLNVAGRVVRNHRAVRYVGEVLVSVGVWHLSSPVWCVCLTTICVCIQTYCCFSRKRFLLLSGLFNKMFYIHGMNWLREKRQAAGLTQSELAKLVGTSGQNIGLIERGERRLSKEWAERIAPHLGCTPIDLLYGERASFSISTNGAVTPERSVPRPVLVVGYVQAGDWREALEWPHDERYAATIFDERFDVDSLIGLEVRGDSMDILYPQGTILICRSFDPTHELPPIGKTVIVQRRDKSGLIEATAKKLELDDFGRGWLTPVSQNSAHKRLPFQSNGDGDDDCAIVGVVVASYRKE